MAAASGVRWVSSQKDAVGPVLHPVAAGVESAPGNYSAGRRSQACKTVIRAVFRSVYPMSGSPLLGLRASSEPGPAPQGSREVAPAAFCTGIEEPLYSPASRIFLLMKRVCEGCFVACAAFLVNARGRYL